MNIPAVENDQPQRLYVKFSTKAWMCGACLAPMALMLWILFDRLAQPEGVSAGATMGCIATVLTLGWLFTRLYALCSVELNADGIAQSTAFGKRIHLPWDKVRQVSFKGLSFHFTGEDGSKIRLSTATFDDAKAAIRAVERLLPVRLLGQLAGLDDRE